MKNYSEVGCMRCGSHQPPVVRRSDLDVEGMICDRCARLYRQARVLSDLLGLPAKVDARESHVEVDGHLFVIDESSGVPVVTDDGAVNAFYAGPGRMPRAWREAGLIDPLEDDDDCP